MERFVWFVATIILLPIYAFVDFLEHRRGVGRVDTIKKLYTDVDS
jgi:hypothetical protein